MGLLREVWDCVLFGLYVLWECIHLSMLVCVWSLFKAFPALSQCGWKLRSFCLWFCVCVRVCVREKARECVKERGSDGVRKKTAVAEEWEISDRTVERDDWQTSFLFTPTLCSFSLHFPLFQPKSPLTSLMLFSNIPKAKIQNCWYVLYRYHALWKYVFLYVHVHTPYIYIYILYALYMYLTSLHANASNCLRYTLWYTLLTQSLIINMNIYMR